MALEEKDEMRRQDVDWLRTFTLGLLILCHVVVGFQPWARTFSSFKMTRPLVFELEGPDALIAFESMNWMFAILRVRIGLVRQIIARGDVFK